MIKILFTSLSGFPKVETGGPNKVIYLIANSLPKNKFLMEFVSKHGRYYFSDENKNHLISNLDAIKLRLFNKSILYRKFFTSSLYLKRFFNSSINCITTLLNESEFDLLNAHDVRAIFNFNTNKKIILSIHSNGSVVNDMISLYGNKKKMQDLYLKFNELEVITLKKVNQIVFPSEAARELYFKDLNLNSTDYNTKVIYNGIDLGKINSTLPDENFSKQFNFLSKRKLKILSVANHIKVKNIDKILHVLSEFKKKTKDFIFINIGSGPLTRKNKYLVKKLGLIENVIFIPMLKNDDVIKMMKSCDVYISLSERVIFDLVILEALACGMKVITSNDGGNREIIKDNFNGYLVDIDDYEKILTILEKKNDMQIRDLAKISVERYSIENMVNEYTKIYDQK